jgi:GntR family transcriptional regulator
MIRMPAKPGQALDSADAGGPLHYRLRELLRARIIAAEFLPDAPLPTEHALMAEYRVSRTTVRAALDALARDRLVYRRQGKGTFVAPPVHEDQLPVLAGFSEQMEARGLHPTAQVVASETIVLSGRDAALLELGEGSKAYRIVRLRSAAGEAQVLSTAIFPFDIGLRIAQEDLGEVGYYPLLEERYGILLGVADQTIEARRATREEGRRLNIAAGAPVLAVERVTRDVAERPIELARGVYRADRYRYRVQLQRRRAPASAQHAPAQVADDRLAPGGGPPRRSPPPAATPTPSA